MAIRRSRPWLRAAWALGLALVAHVLMLGSMALLSVPIAPLEKKTITIASDESSTETPFEIDSLVDELNQPTQQSFLQKWREEEQKKELESKNPTGQVVELPRPFVEERPDSSKYLSEFDSKVDHEKKAPPGKGGSTPIAVPRGQPEPPGKSGGAQAEQKTLAMRAPSPRSKEFGELGETRAGSERDRPTSPMPTGPASESGSDATGTQGLPGGAPGAVPNLHPTQQMLEKAIGAAPGSPDYLKDVDDGEATALNAKKWKHAPFFNRVKRQVASEWHPDTVYIQHDPSGHIYGLKDRITVVRVHLDPSGKLVHSDLSKSSGVDFLDDEALAAFERAGPFPNPPKDLVESDGQIHFNFAFIFQVSGAPGFRIFRN